MPLRGTLTVRGTTAGRPNYAGVAAEQPPEKRRFGRGRIFGALLLGALFAAAALWLIGTPPEPGEPGRLDLGRDISAAGFDFITDKENRLILHLKPAFIVNLAGLDGRYVMRVAIWLEVNDRAVVTELNENVAGFHRMVDEIVRILKSYSYHELAMGDGIERLKRQLRQRLNRYIRRGRITNIFFRELYFAELLPYARRIES